MLWLRYWLDFPVSGSLTDSDEAKFQDQLLCLVVKMSGRFAQSYCDIGCATRLIPIDRNANRIMVLMQRQSTVS